MKTTYIATLVGMALLASSQAALIGEYTFNNTGSGTVAQRMPVALGSSSVATGAGLSVLGTNTIQQLNFKGFNNLSWPSNEDAFSFGNAGSGAVMFFTRSEAGFPTAWGAGGSTAATHTPLSFTLTASAGYSITVDSITLGSQGAQGSAALWAFQEENAAQGAFVADGGAPGFTTANLTSPVVIGEGTAKTFTISINSYVNGADTFLDNIAVNGSVTAIPEPATLGLFGLAALGAFAARRFKI